MNRVILFTDSLGAGGAQRQIVGLAQLLQEKSFDVTVLTYHNDEFYLPLLQKYAVNYVLLQNVQRPIRRILKVLKFVKQNNPDTLIAYQETPSLIACFIKMVLPKIKIIVSERNTTQVLDLKTKLRFFLYKWVDYIVPNSYSQGEYIKKCCPKLAYKIITISNFVDLQNFSPVKRVRKQKPTIMVAASIWPSKNTLGFIDALKIVKDRGFGFEVKWYGKSNLNIDYFNKSLQKIKALSLDDCVHLLDKSKDIKRKYDEADFFCLPSFYEGTPNVICEAISCGLPVLCSNVCDNSIYVYENENGFLFDPNSPENIADKIICALNMEEHFYYTYSKKSRIIAEEKLSSSLFIEKYLKIIK
ncbi:MAG: glycosyltransferase family 4 protein [Bacteroidaceae bacterium]|nr:glycosyltransferase family 4 protein [Bacteroidaceae bacterium]